MMANKDDARTFLISVAAELAGMHAQTLRTYDRLGLVSPQRSSGGGRRYSQHAEENALGRCFHMLNLALYWTYKTISRLRAAITRRVPV